jgi:hypothetical protein
VNIIQWAEKYAPCRRVESANEIEFVYGRTRRSTLFKPRGIPIGHPLLMMKGVYDLTDGADLVGSAFKLGGIAGPRAKRGSPLVPSVSELVDECKGMGIPFKKHQIAFMYQAGIGYYAFDTKVGDVIEWDSEDREITERYPDVFVVFDEWAEA